MPNYDNELSGALFMNDKKDNANAPDFKGECEIHGTKIWISGWKKVAKEGGAKYISLAFTPAEEQQQPASQSGLHNKNKSADPWE